MRRRLPITFRQNNTIMYPSLGKETSEAAGLSLETGGFAFMVSDVDGYLLLLSADYRLLARRISFRGAKNIKTWLVDGIQLMTLQIVDGLAI